MTARPAECEMVPVRVRFVFASRYGSEVSAEVRELGKRHLIALAKIVEQRAHPRRNLMINTNLLGQRVDIVALFFESEMQMGTSRQSGRSNPSDNLAHVNPRIRMDVRTDSGQMPVDADHAALMLDANGVAELARPSRLLDPAVGDRLYRRAILRNEIDSDVRTIGVKQRMVAVESEPGRNVLEIERKTQELRPERVSVLVIQMRGAVLIAKGECA